VKLKTVDMRGWGVAVSGWRKCKAIIPARRVAAAGGAGPGSRNIWISQADLLDLVAQLVEDYEGTHHTPPDALPA
jgi:hypothetical protein